jgi:FkbM family methyltransferase
VQLREREKRKPRIEMHLNQSAYLVYAAGRKAAQTLRLAKPLRKFLGPVVGLLVFKVSSDSERPSMINGHKMVLAQGNRYPPFAMAQNKYEQETTRLLKRILEPGMTFIDVGAHVGYYTLMAAKQVAPTGRVFSFEPEPSNYDILIGNIHLNEYSNVKTVNKAVSSRIGTTTLFLTALDNGRHSTYRHGLPESGSVEIETTTVDAFLEAEGWPEVDLVKIDVEGAEMDVLDGMGQLLHKSDAPKLIVEFNPSLLQSAGVIPAVLLERLTSAGFQVNYIDENKGLSPLEPTRQSSVISKLVKTGGSANLLCTRE